MTRVPKYNLLLVILFFLFCDKGPPLDQVVSNLYSASESERKTAANILFKKGRKSIPYLNKVLKEDKNEIAQILSLRILGKLKGKEPSIAIIPALKSKSTDIRLTAAKILENIELADTLLPYLIEISNDNYANIRIHALSAIGRFKDSSAVNTCAMHLSDPNATVRDRAIKSLLFIGGDMVIKILRQCLNNPDDQVRYIAVQSMASFADTVSAPKLLEMVKFDSNNFVREKAISTLTMLNYRPLVPVLKEKMRNKGISRKEIIAIKKALDQFTLYK